MRTAWVFALSIVVFFMTTSALAIKVDSLYKSTAPVTTQATAERNQATRQALEQVMIKVSGDAQILNNPKLKSNLSAADTLIQQFSYTTLPPGKSTTPYLLEVQFDPTGVNQWLRDAGAAIWGQNRPLVIAWIVYEGSGHPAEIISSDSISDISTLLKQNAEKRGLPLVLPVMDMTEINQITPKDVTDMTISKLTDAAKRYVSDAVLIGHITQDSNGLASQWKLVLGDHQWDWNLAGKSIIDIAPTLINNITNTLATRFAVVTTNTIQKDLALKVTGITHYRDFAQLTRYLNHLTPVANVEITKILSDNDVILKVSLRSTQESFVQALALGKKLTPAPITNAADTMVVYQWNP